LRAALAALAESSPCRGGCFKGAKELFNSGAPAYLFVFFRIASVAMIAFFAESDALSAEL
jgi:hypothetical protein